MTFISKIRVAKTSRVVDAEIYHCAYADMVDWDRHIHKPFIARSGNIGSDWDWPAKFLGCQFSELALGRNAIAFQIRVANDLSEAVPVAQAILSYPYFWPGDKSDHCVFVWLIAATPVAALQRFRVQDRFSTLPPLLDTAIQLSLRLGLEGRIALHAATGGSPEESDALMDKYRNQGLRQRSKLGAFFRFPFRPDDGRLFYFTPQDALAYAKKQDDLR